jgi:hypothetical protein
MTGVGPLHRPAETVLANVGVHREIVIADVEAQVLRGCQISDMRPLVLSPS